VNIYIRPVENNSMIKVGQIIGDRISGPFNTNPNRDTAICRKTIFNILNEFKSISAPIVQAKTTPKILYIMADRANWIKHGKFKLRQHGTKVSFAIDKFHFHQAINEISNDPDIYSILTQYSYHNLRKDFIKVVDSIIDGNSKIRDIISHTR